MAATLLTDLLFSARVIPAYWEPVTWWTPLSMSSCSPAAVSLFSRSKLVTSSTS
ncbi:hypothetical protein MAA44156_03545 [Mycobacterium avium subsp. avium]|nr:hypothetical protein MAA44156_03545 [Mycobacterium avium subsp. avium]